LAGSHRGFMFRSILVWQAPATGTKG